MLRNRSRAVTKKQPLMADQTSQSQSSPTQNYTKPTSSFFGSPRFRAFPVKGLFETESVMSPTSILDPKPFYAFKNPVSSDINQPKSPKNFSDNKHAWENSVSNSIGLALLISSPSSEGKVLFGANLKIQNPLLSPSFSLFSVSPSSSGSSPNQSSNSAIKTGISSSPSPRVVELISVSEMKLSEEYTCVISHGPNPKTTHIFGNCIVESYCTLSDQSNQLSKSFLSFCHTCKKDLEQKNDIYIYRGEKAFCSHECRHQEMISDGLENLSF